MTGCCERERLKIIEKTQNMEKIDHLENYWYKVLVPQKGEYWVFGAYLDIEE